MKFFKQWKTQLYGISPNTQKKMTIVFFLLLIGNVLVWVITITASIFHPILLGLVVLSYGLGLRHGVDADHIAAIDNTTRKLIQDGKRPIAVGFFFSLGHSTVVIALCIVVSISALFIKHNLQALQTVGSLIGTLISSVFLLLIGIINLFTLLDIVKQWKKVVAKKNRQVTKEHVHLSGLLSKIFNPFLQSISKSWHMYPIGLLFGLGFDTASEVALLALSATTVSSGLSFLEILLLPLAFTAGMALVDTTDGLLMLGAYGWAFIHPVRKLYYNLTITLISIIIALGIGTIEVLQLVSSQLSIHNRFIRVIAKINFSSLGFIIIGIFALCWLVSIAIYKIKKFDALDTQ